MKKTCIYIYIYVYMYPLVIGNQSWQRTRYREMEVSMGKSVINRGLFIAMFDNWMVKGILVLDLYYIYAH